MRGPRDAAFPERNRGLASRGREKGLRGQGGFTLVELLVVAAILAVLASLLAPKVLGALDDARKKAAVADAGNVRQAMERYLLDNEQYPDPAVVTDYASLRTALASYMGFPADAAKASFTFVSYARPTPDTYTLKVKARDRNQTAITVTPDGVSY